MKYTYQTIRQAEQDENGGTDSAEYWAAKDRALQEEHDELRRLDSDDNSQYEAAIKASWSLEVTISRRAEWNTLVKSGAIKTAAQLAAQQRRQGWTVTDLKAAVAVWGL